MSTSSRLAVLLFTDIVGSTDLKGRIGAAAYASVLQRHNELFETLCRDEHGDVLKHTGDGFFAAFTTASDAVRAALRFQHAVRTEPWPHPLGVRIGIHVGEVAVMEMAGRPDVVGVAADVAARVMSVSSGGQILLTGAAFNDARQFVAEHPAIDSQPLPPLRWIAHGPYLFAGVDEPVELFEVGGDGVAPLKAPTGGERARRVVPHDQEPTLGWRPAVGLSIPQRPGWALEKRLGEGGFGEVWLGHHERTKQRRVFKFCFDADRLRSFKRELTLFRLLREALGERPDIARLYEVKLDEPPFFLESEWTEGGNLVDWAESRGGIATLPLEQRLEIVAKVCDAVAAAHSVGILHKDIKPSNVLVQQQPDGTIQPRLADFGIGFLADRSQLAARHITETGFTVITQTSGSSMTGTRLYAPPEVLAGKPFTTQGDIYALGVLLYQMAVGDLSRPMAEGWDRDVSDELIRQDIAACCDGDPARRPAGAGEVAQHIRALPQRREAQRQRELAAQSAERRHRVVRRSIATTIAMALLAVAVAASSAFYIRRVRAAQRAETEQRQRAEDAEKAAKAQAASSKRLAAHYYAEYLLIESHVKEAYEKALEANVPPTTWEDGHLLQKIVSAARQNWHVVGRVAGADADEVGPGMGYFVPVGENRRSLLVPRGNAVKIYSVPSGDHLGTITCAAGVGAMCPAAPGRILIASGRTVMLWDVALLKQLATAQEDHIVVQISAEPQSAAVAVLDRTGRISARAAADLSLLARHQLNLVPTRSPTSGEPTIRISPSGKRVIAQTGVWTDGIVDWDVQSGNATTRPFTAHTFTFVDEEKIGGYWSWGMGMDESLVRTMSLDHPEERPVVVPLANLQSKTSARLTMWTDPQIGRGRIAVVSVEGLDIRAYPSGAMICSDLYASILPLSTRKVRVIAQDLPHGNLALVGDDLLLLERGGESDQLRWQAGWSMCTSDRGMLTCKLVGENNRNFRAALTLTPFAGGPGKTCELEWPLVEGKEVLPWGIWSPPDGSFVAVVRQESEPGERAGTVGGDYFGKSIAIYDTASAWPDPPAVLKMKEQFPLPEYETVDARENRFICVTPDRKVALFVAQGTAARYRVSDGKLLSRERLGPWSTPSQDGRLIASGGSGNEPVQVRDIATNSIVFKSPSSGNARRACFSSDSRFLCVGWSGQQLSWYDLSTGATTRTLSTPLLPVAVPARGDRFVGFLSDSLSTGNTVLASTADGEVVDVLNRGANIINTAWFDPSGLCVAMIRYRDESQLVRSITLAEARAALDTTSVPAGKTPTTVPTVTAQMPAVTTMPSASTQGAAGAVVSWEDAGVYIGQTVCVEMSVANARNIGTRCFLNASPRRQANFVIVLNPSTFDKWPEPPEKWFLNKKVRVTGEVKLYRGSPEIIVDDPKQIEIVDQP